MEVGDVSDKTWLFPYNNKMVQAAMKIIASMNSNFLPLNVSLINFIINVRERLIHHYLHF